jgi:hypothetical protein
MSLRIKAYERAQRKGNEQRQVSGLPYHRDDDMLEDLKQTSL